ncbi:MAG: M1 family metallopeptidase, partial [Anaerolineales bacterium]
PQTAGTVISVAIDYGGTLRPVDSPFIPGVVTGPTLGAQRFAFVSQPDMASAWMPINDHPIDAARYRFVVTVPQPYEAVANGELLETLDHPDGSRTFIYDMPDQMASYLATMAVGDYTVIADQTAEGIPLLHYVYAGSDPATMTAIFDDTPLAMDILTGYFGPYPYDSYGHVLVPLTSAALETQTLSVMPYRLGEFGDPIIWRLIVHELAHQWFGNYVRLETWADIWLNEGFATWAEWLADEARYGPERAINNRHRAEGALSNSRRTTPLAEPRPGEMFSIDSYQKGGWVLHMLRAELGDDVFFPMLQAYVAAFAEDTVTSAEFFSFIEDFTGQNLDTFEQQWLYQPGLPRYTLYWTSEGTTANVRLCSHRDGQRYTFDLPIEFQDGGGSRELVRLALDGAQADAAYSLGFIPRDARIDPFEDVLDVIDARRVNALPTCG